MPASKWLAALNVVCLVVMASCAIAWSWFVMQVHENMTWFTNIEEVEREISFRTEQGLYYSYFKVMTADVAGESLWAAAQKLMSDTLTEHSPPDRTINIFRRFNIYPELTLATLYRSYVVVSNWLGMSSIILRPIFFYTYAIFSWQALLIVAMFLLTWSMTLKREALHHWTDYLGGIPTAGLVTVALAVVNRDEFTRVVNSAPLREHFAVPVIFVQFVLVGLHLVSRRGYRRYISAIGLCNVTIIISWQFGQFVLLLQNGVLLILWSVGIIDKSTTIRLLSVATCSILAAYGLLHFQPMVVTSLALSFSFTSLAVVTVFTKWPILASNGPLLRPVAVALCSAATTLVINFIIKLATGQSDDLHILRYVQTKLGLVNKAAIVQDFELNLYTCLPIFHRLESHYFVTLGRYGALYIASLFVGLELLNLAINHFGGKEKKDANVGEIVDSKGGSLSALAEMRAELSSDSLRCRTIKSFNDEKKANLPSRQFDVDMDSVPRVNPLVVFHCGQFVAFGLLALTTSRMKVFWSPYLCIMAGLGVTLSSSSSAVHTFLSPSLRSGTVGGKFRTVQHLIGLAYVLFLFADNIHDVRSQLNDLREFYDPETVDLMHWISANTSPTASFAGSMQLMSAIRLSTMRPIANHPHFEDKELRNKTRSLYKMYGRFSLADVHATLQFYRVDYIVVENSICMHATESVCSTGNNVDMSFGFLPNLQADKRDEMSEFVRLGLKPNKLPYFCNRVGQLDVSDSKMFASAFENKKFRIYRVLS